MEAITTKKISNTFFLRDPIRTENLETNRNFVVHIFVYQRVVQVVFSSVAFKQRLPKLRTTISERLGNVSEMSRKRLGNVLDVLSVDVSQTFPRRFRRLFRDVSDVSETFNETFPRRFRRCPRCFRDFSETFP